MPVIAIQAATHKETTATEITRNTLLPLLAAAMLALASPAVAAEWMTGGTVETVYNDNVSHSPLADDVRSDSSVELAVWRAFHLQLADYTSLHLQGTLTHQQFRHFEGLSSTRLSGTAELSHKFGLGADVPVLSLTTVIERSLYNDTRRDQSLYRASVAVRQRIRDEWQLSVTAAYERQDGDYSLAVPLGPYGAPKPGNAWDVNSWQLAFNAEWDLGGASWLSTTLAWRDGDIVASTSPYAKVLDVSSAVAADPLFGAWTVAYRLPATTRTLSLDWNHAVGESSTLYVGAERQWSHGANDLVYQVGIIRAGFLHNF